MTKDLDPYRAGDCPKCGKKAAGTYRPIGAPVFCENRHLWFHDSNIMAISPQDKIEDAANRKSQKNDEVDEHQRLADAASQLIEVIRADGADLSECDNPHDLPSLLNTASDYFRGKYLGVISTPRRKP